MSLRAPTLVKTTKKWEVLNKIRKNLRTTLNVLQLNEIWVSYSQVSCSKVKISMCVCVVYLPNW